MLWERTVSRHALSYLVCLWKQSEKIQIKKSPNIKATNNCKDSAWLAFKMQYVLFVLFSVSFIRLHPETWSTDHYFPVVYSYMSVKAKLNYSCVWWIWELWIWVVYVSNSRFIIFTVFICLSHMHRAYFLFLLWQITFRI